MANKWALPAGPSSSYLVVWPDDQAARDSRRHASPFQVQAAIDQWLRSNKRSLREINDTLEKNQPRGLLRSKAPLTDDILKKRLSEAFISGKLVALVNPQAASRVRPTLRDRAPAAVLTAKPLGLATAKIAAAPFNDPGDQPFSRKDTVRKFGIAYKPEGVNLREKPSPNARVLKHLAFNTRVFVDSHDNGWYFVTTDDGRFGYCVATHLDTDLPEPNAKIHWIQQGQTALSISHKHYGGKAAWGKDHRFFVNGLVYANLGEGQRGIFKQDPNADWDTTKVIAGKMIWIPSLAFLQSLRGKVSSASITYEAWETVKTAAQAIAEITLGTAAFIAGLLHGALESLWDVLVGLKDLAVMLWDILASLFTGNLFSDASGLWNDLSKRDWKAVAQGWIDRFDAKWNASGLLERWHFRGWVIGYAIMEALMLFFSGGVIQGIKWVGKASKVSKLLKTLPQVQKLATTVKANKAYQKVATMLGKGAAIAETAADAKKWIGQLMLKPKSIWGKGPDQIADVFRKAGYEVTIAPSTKGSKLSKQIQIKKYDIQNIQVHPGGGRHGGSYYKLSTSSKGIIKVVDRATYIPTPGEKATIIFIDTGLQGWMLQAAAANALAQNALEELDVSNKSGGR